jgi:hypothetical protein
MCMIFGDTPYTGKPWKVTQIDSVKNRAYVWTDRPYPKGVCVAEVRAEMLGELEHNAELIAAAPDLAESLAELQAKIDAYLEATGHVCGVNSARVALIETQRRAQDVLGPAERLELWLTGHTGNGYPAHATSVSKHGRADPPNVRCRTSHAVITAAPAVPMCS